jgi:type I restriction enzyme S subunit
MEATMEHTSLKIDKSRWKPVKFGDVVAEPKEICKDIIAERIEHVVGLEHIDTGDLHLRKFATTEENTTFSKKFKKGDVLFGRRRAYLKKAAQADFDGICSGDITVLRAKKVLSSALLPFIVNNDKFFDYAVKHSAGGLSPRVKFKDLANYEFLLPPKEEQASLVELLWAMDEVIEKEKSMVEKVILHRSAVVENLINSNDFKTVKLKELLSRPKPEKAKDIDRDKILSVRLHLKGVCKNTSVDGLKLGATQYFVRKAGQFIYGKQNLFNGAIGIVPIELNKFLSSTDIPALDIETKKILPQYLMIYFGREKWYKNLEKHSSGSGSKRISENLLFEIEIKLPNIDRQSEIVLKIYEIEKMIEKITLALSSSIDLQKSLINQTF